VVAVAMVTVMVYNSCNCLGKRRFDDFGDAL